MAVQPVQFNIDSRFNEDARYKKVLFGYNGQLLEVELNELQDIMNARLAEVVDNVFGSRPLYVGTYSIAGGVLTITNEVVVANRELILLNSTSIPVSNGDTIYLNVQTATKAYTDSIKKYGDQNSNTTVTNSIEDSRVGQETTRRVQVTYMLSKSNANPGTNIQLCTISSGVVVKGNPDSFADSALYSEIRRLANEQITTNNLQPLKNVYGTVVAGGTSVPATSTADTLTFTAGTAVSITGTAASKTVNISVPNATTTTDGSLSAADKTKLNGIATGAQVNQNAFSNAIVGASTLSATTTTDSLTFAASGAITVSGSGKTVTIGMPNATPTADGSMASGDKSKLNGIATGAEVNQNAWSTVTAGGTTINSGSKTDTLAFATSGAITLVGDATNKKVTIGLPNATEAADGGMSAADKTKLDGIASGAQVNQNGYSTIVAGGTTMAATSTTDTFTFAASGAITVTGSGKTATIGIPAASSTVTGSMSSTDKAKLDAINQALSTSDSPSFSKVTSTVATGTAPLTVTSTTMVTNLNANYVNGYSFNQSLQTTDSPSFSKVTSTVATGTAPFTVSSTTNVTNLSADMVDGFHLDQDVRTTASPTHSKLTLNVATGTAPLVVTSTTNVTNLSADMVDGYHMNQNVLTTSSPTFAGLTFSAAQGTAPMTVTSTTNVTNLSADMVDGFHMNQDVRSTASPTFAGVTVNGTSNLNGALNLANNGYILAKGTATSGSNYSSFGLQFQNSTWNGSAAVANGRTLWMDASNNVLITNVAGSSVVSFDNNGGVSAQTFSSGVATGTAPLTVASTTMVANLNANYVSGYSFNQSLQTTDSPTFAKVTAPTLVSTVATGTAPLTVSSTTAVTNLNADMVDGYHMNQNVQTTSSPSFAGLTVGGNTSVASLSKNGASDFYLIPASTMQIGFVNNAQNAWGLRVVDGASPKTYTLNNTLDDGSGNASFRTITSTVATGTAPFTVASSTLVSNLNANYVNGYSFNQSLQTSNSPTFSALTLNVASGTAPMTVTSTTKVTNLNVDMVDGYNFNQGVQTTDSPTFAKVTAPTFASTVATGTAPLTVSSTTLVSNLNANYVNGYSFNQGVQTTDSPSFNRVTSTVATGTAPFTVSSSTMVTNLNANYVSGYSFNQSLQTSDSPSFSKVTASTLVSTVATGTAPFTVTSTTMVSNLNAQYVGGYQPATTNTASSIVLRDSSGNFSAGTITATLSGNASSASSVPWSGVSGKPTTLSGYGITDAVSSSNVNQAVNTTSSPTFAQVTAQNFVSTTTSSAPFTVSSSTMVTNLNANYVGGTALAGLVQIARQINPGTGLTGGGSLSSDVTLSVSFGGSGSAATVARSDHNHSGTYVNTGGDTMTGTLNVPTVANPNGDIWVIPKSGSSIRMSQNSSSDGVVISGNSISNPYNSGNIQLSSGSGAGSVMLVSPTDDIKMYINNNKGLRVANSAFNGYVPVYASTFTTMPSTREDKMNLEEVPHGVLDQVMSAKVYDYHVKSHFEIHKVDKDGNVKTVGKRDPKDVRKQRGVMIDESPKEMVMNGEGIDLYAMVSTLWKAVQEHKMETDTLKARIQVLEDKLAKA